MTEPDPPQVKEKQRVTLVPVADEAPPSTQLVVLVWCLWLVGAWGVSVLFDSPVPAARWLMATAMVGLMLVWPAVRLSEDMGLLRGRFHGDRRDRSGGHFRNFRRSKQVSAPAVLVEWLCLVLVFQAVIWPLRLISDWRMDQTAWLDGAVMAWSLLIAAVVAMGTQFRGSLPRTVAMALCALLVVGEPLALAVAGLFGDNIAWEMRMTPLPTIWALSHPIAEMSLAPWPARILPAGAAAVAAWIVVAVVAWVDGRKPGA